MTVPSGPVPSFRPGPALQNGSDLQKMAQMLGSTVNGVVAKAGGTKALATPITAPKARITVCATAADSVLLPPGYPGLQVSIMNSGVASVQVFGYGTDTINGIATATGVAQAAGLSALYTCYDVVAGVGIWGRVLSA